MGELADVLEQISLLERRIAEADRAPSDHRVTDWAAWGRAQEQRYLQLAVLHDRRNLLLAGEEQAA